MYTIVVASYLVYIVLRCAPFYPLSIDL